MKICALCKNKDKEANQTGSHIFTHGLIKSAINQQGVTKRSNKEIIATISSHDLVDTFFGSGVQPNIIEEVRGQQLTDDKIEELRNKKDPFTRDYLFCSDCEKRFTVAENYFLDNVYPKLEEAKSNDTDKFGNPIVKFETLSNELLRIFILIQIWRASVSNYEGFKLPQKVEEKLGESIDKVLVLGDLKETLKRCEENKEEINQYPLIITFMETDANSDPTENVIFIDKSKYPYMMILNNIIIQFFEKEKHIRSTPQYFWGLAKVIEKEKHFNSKNRVLKIGKINNNKRLEIINNIYKYLADKISYRINDFIKDAYKRVLGYYPSSLEIDNINNEIFKDNNEPNINHVVRTTAKAIFNKIN